MKGNDCGILITMGFFLFAEDGACSHEYAQNTCTRPRGHAEAIHAERAGQFSK